jgi:hypothetical protein
LFRCCIRSGPANVKPVVISVSIFIFIEDDQ